MEWTLRIPNMNFTSQTNKMTSYPNVRNVSMATTVRHPSLHPLVVPNSTQMTTGNEYPHSHQIQPRPPSQKPMILLNNSYNFQPRLISGPRIRPLFVQTHGRERKQRAFLPEERKDDQYWEKRRRNNASARRSRAKRKFEDVGMEERIQLLNVENKRLRSELVKIHSHMGYSGLSPDKKSKTVVAVQNTLSIDGFSSSDGHVQDTGATSSYDGAHALGSHCSTKSTDVQLTLNNRAKDDNVLDDQDYNAPTQSDVELTQHTSIQTTATSVDSTSGGSNVFSLPLEENSSKDSQDTRSDTSASPSEQQKRLEATLKSLPYKLRYKMDYNWGYSEGSSTAMENLYDSSSASSGSIVGSTKQISRCLLKQQRYLVNRMKIIPSTEEVASHNTVSVSIYPSSSDARSENVKSDLRRELDMMKKELEEFKHNFNRLKGDA